MQQTFGKNFAFELGATGNLELGLVAHAVAVAHIAPPTVSSARTTALRSSGILKALPASGVASASAPAAAARKLSTPGAAPTSAASLWRRRQGRAPTPPAASLASMIFPFSIRRHAATETTANSNDARSRTLR